MRANILTPWFSFSSTTEREAFMNFLEENDIKVENFSDRAVQLSGEHWTADLLKNISDDFDTWCESFHADILAKEYTKLALIVARYHADRDSLAKEIGKYFEQNNDSRKEDDYFEVLTNFFQYTIYCEGKGDEYERNIYLSDHVDCYPLGGDCNGVATVMLNNHGNLTYSYRKF